MEVTEASVESDSETGMKFTSPAEWLEITVIINNNNNNASILPEKQEDTGTGQKVKTHF